MTAPLLGTSAVPLQVAEQRLGQGCIEAPGRGDGLPSRVVVLGRQSRGRELERGLKIANGLDMLLHQAVRGFELWFGVRPEVTKEQFDMLAADIAAVIEHEKAGPAFVVGHAFGNRVARMLATDRPDLVKAVSLIAANVGRNPSPPNVRAAIRTSADLKASDEERVKAMQFVFFAPGSDARVWLTGWYPDVLAAQRIAGDRTSRELDYAAGKAPILYIQPSHDPLARVDEADEYKHAIGDRVTVVVISNSAHAVIVEQPNAVSDALIAYAKKLWPNGQ